MISENVQAMLNRQIGEEAYASSAYLSMAAWCDSNGYQGSASFLYHSSDEERGHALKFLHYVVDSDGKAHVPAVKEPPQEFNSVPEIFESVLEMEMAVAAKIHTIADAAMAEKDHATYSFLQFFIEEQRNAETQSRQILDTIKVIGIQGVGLYEIDRYLGRLAKEKEE
jgi:ferritin